MHSLRTVSYTHLDVYKRQGLRPEVYAFQVQAGDLTDRTLTPLLRYGLNLKGVIEDYMEDEESLNCAALLSYERS